MAKNGPIWMKILLKLVLPTTQLFLNQNSFIPILSAFFAFEHKPIISRHFYIFICLLT